MYSFDTLLISGMKSKSIKDSEEIHKQVGYILKKQNINQNDFFDFMIKAKPGLCSLIKVDDVEDVLGESPEKLADSVILFCQV